MSTRRTFIKKAMATGAATLSIPQIVSAALANEKKGKPITLAKGDVILFQGDSITDVGRNREELTPNNGKALGGGYAFLASCSLLNKHAEKDLSIYNRGISGNKVYQLAERWDADCINLKPTVLSILIGVNDFWHMLNGKYDGTIETYRKDYQALIERTKQQLPHVKLIICEPFAVTGTKAVDDTWFPRFAEYQKAAREIADKSGATFIPFQSIFNTAIKSAPAVYWTPDGVHPSLAGSQLMAEAWLATVK